MRHKEPVITKTLAPPGSFLRAGTDVNKVSYWPEHADISSIHIYVEIDMEMKPRMLQKNLSFCCQKASRMAEARYLTETQGTCQIASIKFIKVLSKGRKEGRI